MPSPRNVGREILFSLLAAGVLGIAFTVYVLSSMPKLTPPVLTTPSEPAPPQNGQPAPKAPQTPPELVQAKAVVESFATALASKRYADAYALMAAPYRATRTLDAFTQTCVASPLLATTQRAAVIGTSRSMLGSGTPGPYTEKARGLLMTGAGVIEASYTLLVDGQDARILVLSLAGVPVLDGVSVR
jgi:hypothetical protein